MAFLTKRLPQLSGNQRMLIGIVAVVLLYFIFISGLSTNPPGFYMDESCLAYNGYLIAHTGASETGASFPLYFQCYTDDYVQFANPTHVYLLAAMYLFVSPSNLSARILAATMVFIAALLLGVLAARIADRRMVGVIVALTAMATPWFFEVSRLVLETFFYPLCIVLFLLFLFNAHQREKWRFSDNVLLAVALALITYSYSIGRLLGPGLAFGLLIFAVNRRALFGVIRTWLIYAITLIPFIYVFITNDKVITQRFHVLTYITADKSWWAIAKQFISNFFEDLSPTFLLLDGDQIGRHHVPVMGEIFIATFILAIIGLFMIVVRRYGDAWWRFVLYGAALSIVPGAITTDRYHSLRLLAFPVFLMILTVPALTWLIGGRVAEQHARGTRGLVIARQAVLVLLMLGTLAQAVYFQVEFRKWGPDRETPFNAAYPVLLDKALAEPQRPIYLKDGRFGPGYIHALWYATVRGVDVSNFHHLVQWEDPPPGSLVLSSDLRCSDCDVILQKDVYVLYKTVDPDIETATLASIGPGFDARLKPVGFFGSEGAGQGQFSRPRGIAADSSGNLYIADAGNSRVEKYDADGKYLASFGSAGRGTGEMQAPNGIDIDPAGNIYVSDSANHKLLKLDPSGQFLNEWSGSPLGFYGPRDIAFGENKQLYILDQGRTRVVKFDPESESMTSWGTSGSGEGQFRETTGITIGGDLVFVADAGSKRIQVFDLDGQFIRQWQVDEWDQGVEIFPDLVYDKNSKRLYVDNPVNKDIIAFDVEGNRIGRIKLAAEDTLNNPTGLCIVESSTGRSLAVLDSGDSRVYLFSLSEAKQENRPH